MPDFIQKESYKNGLVIGALLGAAILFGDYIKQPLLDFINNIIPETYQFGGFTAIAVIIAICAGVGYWADKT